MHCFGTTPRTSDGKQRHCRAWTSVGRPRRAQAWAALIGAGLLLLPACSATDKPAAPSPLVPAPMSVSAVGFAADRLYVLPGETAVFPLTPLAPAEGTPQPPGLNWRPERIPRVVLENGVEIVPRVFRVIGALQSAQAAGTGRDQWLRPPLDWRCERYDPAHPPAPVEASGIVGPMWLAELDMPANIDPRALPRFARIDGLFVPLTWMTRPPAILEHAAFAGSMLKDHAPEAEHRLALRVNALWNDPLERWRARMLADRLGGALGTGEKASPLDEPLEQLAQQLETCIRVALDNLRRAEPALADQVAERLTHVVRFPDEELLPAWAPNDAATTELMTRLLDPHPLRAERAEAARAWLSAEPGVGAWVVDDMGDPAGASGSSPTLGVCDLSGNGAAVGLAATGVAGVAGVSVEPCGSALATPPVPLVGAGRSVQARAGGQGEIDLPLIGGVLPAHPPGIEMGPMLRPWTLESWWKRTTVAAAPDHTARVLVQRSASGEWEALVQCPLVGDRPAPDDAVRLWLGPFNAARVVIEITPVGARLLEPKSLEPARDGDVENQAAGWSGGWARVVKLPISTVESRTLLIGAERDAGGVRCAYPRPLMPGQREPGRLGIDLTGWEGLPSS